MAPLFLGFAGIGLVLALNAWRPLYRPAPISVVSFFAGWLTAELALHWIAFQTVFALAFIYRGALSELPGQVALGVMLLSIAVLVLGVRRSFRARSVFREALVTALGEKFEERLAALGETRSRGIHWGRILFPFGAGERDVERTRNLVFNDANGVRLRLDVFRHRSKPQRSPILIYVHGGAWVIGKREYQGLPFMKHLAARGWLCFSVDYRLSPKATFPDHLIDVKRAIAWVREHAVEYGGDPEFVVIAGNSAGGHLASLAALTQGDPEYQPGFEDADTTVAACLPFYGVYDFVDEHRDFPRGMAYLLERLVMKAKRATSQEAFVKASPTLRVHDKAPPFFVVHGDTDSIAPTQGARRFVEAFRKASPAPIAYAEVPGAQHAFEVFPSLRTAFMLDSACAFASYVYLGHLEAKGRVAVTVPPPPDVALVSAEPSSTGELSSAPR